jgi:LPXTG-motif cell wall-anchored protein
MTNFKKITSAAAAIMIAATMMAGTVAFAEDKTVPTGVEGSNKISVNSTSSNTYDVYQLLEGGIENVADSNPAEKVFVEPAAGFSLAEGKTVDDILAFADDATISAKTVFSSYYDSTKPVATLRGGDVCSVENGYYLVVETDAADNTKTAGILKVVDGDVDINSKLGAVTFEKKLKDINDSTDTNMTAWQDGADHDIGDAVPFQLKATLPENVDQYEGYYLKFTDELNDAFNVSTVKDVVVKVGDKIILPNTIEGANTGYDWVTNADSNSFTLTFPDIKHVAEKKGIAPNNAVVTVEYTAVLGDAAAVGTNDDKVTYGNIGNENTAYATYSNNPEFDMYPKVGPGDDVEDTTDETDKPGTPDEDNREDTEEDKVIVFTYKTVIKKVDEDEKPLNGAVFVLYKLSNNGENKETIDRMTVDGNVFTFYGLDDGDYRLEEVDAPSGYKSIDPIEFTVSADHDVLDDNPKLTALTAKICNEEGATDENFGTVDVMEGSIETEIENTKGSKLPETGGIGTKLFYAVGGGLAGLAGIALITKKRMSKKN